MTHQEETPVRACQCEHHSHFETKTSDPMQQSRYYGGHRDSTVHTYGAPARELQPVKTPFGTFHVCQTCADTCYREYL
jgi:hypothetical protein